MSDAVEHVTCPDEEFWTCGEVVLQDSSLGFELSVRGMHRLFLTRATLEQISDIVRARDNRVAAVAGGWLTETKDAS